MRFVATPVGYRGRPRLVLQQLIPPRQSKVSVRICAKGRSVLGCRQPCQHRVCTHLPFLSATCFAATIISTATRLCLTMKRKAKKKKPLNDGESGGPAARTSPDGPAAPTSTSTLSANWNDLSASQAIALGGGLAATQSEQSQWQQFANHLARPSAAEPSEGRYAPSYASAANLQASQQALAASSRGGGAAAGNSIQQQQAVGLEELAGRFLYSSSQSSNAHQQLSAHPFLQREAQRNQAFAEARNVAYRGESSFHPESQHERIRFEQVGMLPALEFHPADDGGASQGWLPYQHQRASHLQDGDMGIPSISSSTRQANQQHAAVAQLSIAHPPASSPRVATSETILSRSTSDDWNSGDPADESASGVSSAHQLPLGAMSPLHFGENETNSSSD